MYCTLSHSPFVSIQQPLSPAHLSSFPINVSSPTKDFACFSNLPFGRFFVYMSLVIFSPLVHDTSMSPSSFNSQRKYCFTSMCQVFPPIDQLLQRSTTPLLSTISFIGF